MPDETRAIEPALTSEEWHDVSGTEGPTALERANLWAQLTPGRMLVARTPGDKSCLIGDEDAHAMMALANAALPDDDPRKITRGDPRLLQRVVIPMMRQFSKDRPDVLPATEMAEGVEYINALAAKLAAFLPPEG